MQAAELPPAVVLGLSPTGLHVVRSLGRAGVAVYACEEGRQLGRGSRYLKKVFSPANALEKLELLTTLFADRAKSLHKPVLLPTSDQDVDFVIENAEKLKPFYAFQSSYEDGLASRIMTKESFYEICEAQRLVYPKAWKARKDDLAGKGEAFVYPVMIKPSRIHDIKGAMKGKKGWIATDRGSLEGIAREIPEDAGTLLIQQVIPGPESEITLCCTHATGNGEFHQTFAARKLRQYPPGFGSAALVQSNPEPETVEITEKLLETIGYRGVAASEFKRHPEDGLLYLIEINVRPSLWFSITEDAGRKVVVSAYRELAGLEPLADRAQVNGVRWRYLAKDIWSTIFYLIKRDFVLPPPDISAVGSARRTVYPVFNTADPMPAIYEVENYFRKAFRRLVKNR